MTAKTADLAAPRNRRILPWIWMFWAALGVAALVMSAGILAGRVMVPDTRQFRGSFVQAQNTRDIVLPAGIPISEILVKEGDLVTVGHRLALFDIPLMEQKISRLNLDILLNAVKRDCLLNRTTFDEASIDDMALEGEMRLAMQAVLRECRLLHQQNALVRARLVEKRDTLRNRAALVLRGLMTNQALQDGVSPRTLALKTAVENQALEAAVRTIDLEIASTITEQDILVLKQVTELRTQSVRFEAELSGLEYHLSRPWLIAPESGRINRLRALEGQKGFKTDVALVRLKTQDHNVFDVHADVANIDASSFRVGDVVSIRLSGLSLMMSSVPGHITALSEVPGVASTDRMTRITVRLVPSLIKNRRLEQEITSQLSTGDKRSAFRLSWEGVSLLERLKRSLWGGVFHTAFAAPDDRLAVH